MAEFLPPLALCHKEYNSVQTAGAHHTLAQGLQQLTWPLLACFPFCTMKVTVVSLRSRVTEMIKLTDDAREALSTDLALAYGSCSVNSNRGSHYFLLSIGVDNVMLVLKTSFNSSLTSSYLQNTGGQNSSSKTVSLSCQSACFLFI
jgi:hypothetical protein